MENILRSRREVVRTCAKITEMLRESTAHFHWGTPLWTGYPRCAVMKLQPGRLPKAQPIAFAPSVLTVLVHTAGYVNVDNTHTL